jgi:glutamate formiminotransferase
MNLVDFRRSSLHDAFRAVAGLAREAGVEVLGSEIVGLVPAAALCGGPIEELRLEDFGEEKILENRLQAHGLQKGTAWKNTD